jgi:hypothetical protein
MGERRFDELSRSLAQRTADTADRFDSFSRVLATPISRRRALRLAAAAGVAAFVPMTRPVRAWAARGNQMCCGGTCGIDADGCCEDCVCKPSNKECCEGGGGGHPYYCDTGAQCCGTRCCDAGAECCGGSTCCPKDTTCCGDKCCAPGLVCQGEMGPTPTCVRCPPGRTPCSFSCCAPGETCKGDTCEPAKCKNGGDRCGPRCCEPGGFCCNEKTGSCCTKTRRSCCGEGNKKVCCPEGQTCRASRPYNFKGKLAPHICCPEARACLAHCCAPGEECILGGRLCCRKDAICSDRKECCFSGHCCEGRYCCPSFAVCDSDKGGCRLCRQGEVSCKNRCTDIRRDKRNCGKCGNVCPGEKVCRNGTCRCASGQRECGNQCCRGGERCEFVKRLNRMACVLPAPPPM